MGCGGHDGRRQCCLLLAPWVPTSHAASQWKKKTENSGLTSPCAASTAFKSAHAKSRSLSEVSRGGGVTERRPPFSQRSAKKTCPRNFDTVSWQQVSHQHFPSRDEPAGVRCRVALAPKKERRQKNNFSISATYDLTRWPRVSSPCVLIWTTSSWHRDPNRLRRRKRHMFLSWRNKARSCCQHV